MRHFHRHCVRSACLLALALVAFPASLQAQTDAGAREELRQQERERSLREQREQTPDVRVERPQPPSLTLPVQESPCFTIERIAVTGDAADRFRWALRAADPPGDRASGRCLGTRGVNLVMKRIQDAIITRGYVTTRVVAAPQDLRGGTLTLTVVPGRIDAIRFAARADPAISLRTSVAARAGEILNLRDIEQSLENLKRAPGATAEINITPADNDVAGASDLVIDWRKPSPARLNLSLDDAGGEATGRTQGGATLSVDNPLGWSDLFYLHAGRGLFNGGDKGSGRELLHYSVPHGYWLLSATASRHDYHQKIAGAYQTYTYRGEGRNGELQLTRLLHRDASSKSSGWLRGWLRQSRNHIDDTEIEVQRRRMAGWELGVGHRRFLGEAVLDASLAYRHGTGAFNALPAPEEAFDEGTARPRLISADLQLVLPFRLAGQSLRYVASGRAQWQRTPLVPQDRFVIGDRYSVRGFDGELSLAGERGWLLRNDLSLRLGDSGQELFLGIDHGRIGGRSARWQAGRHITGGVVGLRGGYRALGWELFAGKPLDKPDHFDVAGSTAGFQLDLAF